MASAEKLLDYQKQVDRLKKEKERISGALDQLMIQLKDEFGCDTVEAAAELLAKLQQDAETAEQELEETLGKFEEEYADVLDA